MNANPTILFVHNGDTGRFNALAERLAARGSLMALVNGAGAGRDLPGARTFHRADVASRTPGVFSAAVKIEEDMKRGVAAAHAAKAAAAAGFVPDLVIGHPAWGEMLFLDQIFPGVPQIQIGEFYYRSSGADVGFDPEFASAESVPLAFPARNATLALSYLGATRIVVPTSFQASLFPPALEPLIAIVHEGVDTTLLHPQPRPRVMLSGGTALGPDTPVITFVNRFLEPLRGFHILMRCLPRLLDAVPQAHVVIVGSDAPRGYGIKPPQGETWKAIMLRELSSRLDLARVHFVGPIEHSQLITLYALSSAHVYLTYPFVLSWSLIEAMACGCLIVGSDTAPVRDVVTDGVNGLLVDFFDADALAARLIAACTDPARFEPLQRAARETAVALYDRRTVCEPAWLRLVDETLGQVTF